ncbi:Signal transduction histidine kinase [Candidatus Terasakiella magnetica]|nr:Signal transduction histidine kinase [Candidatus Terasakiella magnetica]
MVPVSNSNNIFITTSHVLAVLDGDGRIEDANPAFCAMAGQPLETLVGSQVSGLCLAEAAQLTRQTLPDGKILLELTGDQSLRLRDQERRLTEMRAIIENTFEFIGLLSPEGLLLDANHTAMSFIGHKVVTPFVGMHFADTPWWEHSPIERAQLIDAIEHARTGEFVRFETTHVDANGGIAYVDFSLKPVRDQAGTITFLVPEGRDITQRKRAEAEVMAAKLEAEAANRAKSSFLATVSHELRTPLNAIIGFSEAIICNALGPSDAERTTEYMGLIHTAGQHLRAVIEDILDVSRIELGQIELEEIETEPGDLVHGIARMLEHKAQNGKITLCVTVDEGLPWIRVDQRRLRQIVLNLLANAIKFTPLGGHIEVTARLCPEGIEIAVKDSGIGISREDLAKVWLPFYQSDASLARRHEGAGLGLAIVKHFVEAHGGTLQLDSTLGQGTRVAFILPKERFV